MLDKNGIELKDGCVIDINQTVNGQSRFFVKSVIPMDVYYDYDRSRQYEYDMSELVSPCRFTGEVDFEVVR